MAYRKHSEGLAREKAQSHIEIPKPPGDPWRTCLEPLLAEDKLRCDAWREEVQNLLIFAGLFSAVVTAFVIQSCQDLQLAASSGQGLLSTAGAATSPSGSLSNDSSPGPGGATSMVRPSASTIRVNVCWITSLILSLMTVLIGIVSLQWIREYQRYPTNLQPKRVFAARNLRYEGLHRWWVPEMFAALPLLLQTALAFFLVGLTDFLLHLNVVVAIPAMALTAGTLSFLAATTIMPALQAIWVLNCEASSSIPNQCPYKSPQSWAFLRLASSELLRTILGTVTEISCLIIIVSPARLILYVFPDVLKYAGGVRRYFSISPTLRHFGKVASWHSFDSFWLHGRQRLCAPESSEADAYITKLVEEYDCDAARGIAHIIDGRAQDEDIAFSAYHAFQQLPPFIITDDVYRAMSRRLPKSMTVTQAPRKCNLLPDSKLAMVRAENEMLLLGRLPQVTAIDPVHIFRKRQLQLFLQVHEYIFTTDYSEIYSCRRNTHASPFNQVEKAISFGRLFVPTCLKTVGGLNTLPGTISEDIKDSLIITFHCLAQKAISIGNECQCFDPSFGEETLGDFMQLMHIITIASIQSPGVGRSQSSSSRISRLTKILVTLSKEATKRSRTSRRCPVYMAIMYVSRFQPGDWRNFIRSAPEGLATAFQDLVESLHILGLTTFTFGIARSFYREQCKSIVTEVLTGGRYAQTSTRAYISSSGDGEATINTQSNIECRVDSEFPPSNTFHFDNLDCSSQASPEAGQLAWKKVKLPQPALVRGHRPNREPFLVSDNLFRVRDPLLRRNDILLT